MAIFPFMMAVYKSMTMTQLMYLLLAGVFASVGQFGITLAYKYAPAKEMPEYFFLLAISNLQIILYKF